MENRIKKQKTRYYVHGDLEDGGGDGYYCAICDLFYKADHFDVDSHDNDFNNPSRNGRGKSHVERYNYSLKYCPDNDIYYRPQNPVNLFFLKTRK